MTAPIPLREPTELRAGLTWQWRREDLTDYPAPTWVLKYWFKRTGAAGAQFSITAAADGTAHAVDQAATVSQTYVAGSYTWAAIATSGADAVEVAKGRTEILPRYDTTAAVDDRSHARKVLESIEAVLERRATRDQEEYVIGSRSLKRTPMADLLKLRDSYAQAVAAEDAQANLASGAMNHPNLLARL